MELIELKQTQTTFNETLTGHKRLSNIKNKKLNENENPSGRLKIKILDKIWTESFIGPRLAQNLLLIQTLEPASVDKLHCTLLKRDRLFLHVLTCKPTTPHKTCRTATRYIL